MVSSKNTLEWTTKDGQRIRICDMGNAHLINAIRLHLRNSVCRPHLERLLRTPTTTHHTSGSWSPGTDHYTSGGGWSPDVVDDLLNGQVQQNASTPVHWQLVAEAMQRGYTSKEILSSTPALDLSEEEMQYLLVYADHFEETGKHILAGVFRNIVTEAKKHAERKWQGPVQATRDRFIELSPVDQPADPVRPPSPGVGVWGVYYNEELDQPLTVNTEVEEDELL